MFSLAGAWDRTVVVPVLTSRDLLHTSSSCALFGAKTHCTGALHWRTAQVRRCTALVRRPQAISHPSPGRAAPHAPLGLAYASRSPHTPLLLSCSKGRESHSRWDSKGKLGLLIIFLAEGAGVVVWLAGTTHAP
jgi:hypothetical protein